MNKHGATEFLPGFQGKFNFREPITAVQSITLHKNTLHLFRRREYSFYNHITFSFSSELKYPFQLLTFAHVWSDTCVAASLIFYSLRETFNCSIAGSCSAMPFSSRGGPPIPGNGFIFC